MSKICWKLATVCSKEAEVKRNYGRWRVCVCVCVVLGNMRILCVSKLEGLKTSGISWNFQLIIIQFPVDSTWDPPPCEETYLDAQPKQPENSSDEALQLPLEGGKTISSKASSAGFDSLIFGEPHLF